MPYRPLPRSTPSVHGIDAVGVLALIDALDDLPGVEPHGLVLLRHGNVVAEGWWHPYTAERPHLLYSLSKSFTVSAVGIAVDAGLIDLDATVLSYFPEVEEEITDPRSRAMLVRHVAAMASGHRSETIDRALANDRDHLVRGFLLVPPDDDPGSVFAYNQPCTFALAEIVRRVSGMSLLDFLRPRLLDPLGIGEVGWRRDRRGAELGFSGLHATTEAAAKLGQLYLARGRWDGAQLVSERWVDEATRTQVENPNEPNPDWRRGYGFQFWMARHGYRGDGAFGQYSIVLPEHDVVLAMTGQSEDMQAVLDAVWRHLIPAIDRAPSTDADAALAERTAALRLPPVEGRPAELTASFDRSDSSGIPTLSSVRVGAAPVGAGASVTLVDSGQPIEFTLAHGGWEVTGAIAASGGIVDRDLLIAVRFIETPHELRLACHLDTGTFDATWVTEPLHGGALSEMRMPRP